MNASQASFDYVCELLHRRAAICLQPGKEYLVDARLAPLVKELGFASIDALVDHLRKTKGAEDPRITREVVEALTTNETSFFRDIHPFDTLRTGVLPSMFAAKKGRPLRIWCAAASTGQEPFSIAMLLREHFPAVASTVTIIATDINRAVLERARAGIFRQIEVNRGLPVPMLIRHFEKKGLDWRLKPEILRMVRFEETNLLERWPLDGAQDVVFMRNVLIYFDVPTKRRILGRVREAMAQDGALFLGGAETTTGLDDAFVSECPSGSGRIFRKR